MSHERRYPVKRRAVKRRAVMFEDCEVCEKRSYLTRSDARRAARAVPGPVHMNSYLCPAADLEFPAYHIGHLPQSVRSGMLPKPRYLRGEHRVAVRLGADGVSLQVTYSDPRDAARICDALLVAAQLAELDSKPTLRDRYIRLANQTADAMAHSDVPSINPTPDLPRQELLA